MQVTADGSGVWHVHWTATEYCRFFAHEKGWLPSDVMTQPVGILDQIIDDIEYPRAVRRSKEDNRSVVQNVTAIETARRGTG